MSRLRGLLSGETISPETWSEVEESLIAGDVGASLATDVVERARRGATSEGAIGAVRRELEAELLAARSGLGAHSNCHAAGDRPRRRRQRDGQDDDDREARDSRTGRRQARDPGCGGHLSRRGGRAAPDLGRPGGCRTSHAAGADPAAVVFDTLDAAVARGADVVIVDTAGRLHTKSNLMDELSKIRRVIDRRLPGATPETLLVLDATTGQNGLAQALAFHEAVGLTGIVLTKSIDVPRRHRLRHRAAPRRARPLRRGGGAAGGDLVALTRPRSSRPC